ncbi:hypothetical protein [Hymenobacter ruricola]|uniref:SMI1/KNR4 family protein n=1 Tax=Hymenobacter ruricola TaxID=2791023 RepID=A0ABS0HYT2_9BACT|nr:hypothetical protein [Hymenobacter ruricola]MBF9219817.1 hypothetical protein [Hymenobacter ruricola]
MSPTVLAQMQQLGGRIDQVEGQSLADDLQAITFDTVLYRRPTDTPWATAAEAEPIAGLNEVVEAHRALLTTDLVAFYQRVADHFYRLTEAPQGQVFYRPSLFTPFRPGTADYAEWNDYFTDSDEVDLSPVFEVVSDPAPDFIYLAHSYGFPDTYFLCLSDPNPANPTVFSTDHEEFFASITNEGPLENFWQRFMSKEELLTRLRERLAQ